MYSKENNLEIVLKGYKRFKIFDKINKKKFISYNLLPFFGIVYSAETQISSQINKDTCLLNIKIN